MRVPSLSMILIGAAAAFLGGCGATPLPPGEPISRSAVPFQYGKTGAVRTTIVISDEAWSGVEAIFEPPPATAEEERERTAAAIGEFEKIAGSQTPTHADRRGSNWPGLVGSGQMDCIDESTNTTNYLRLLDAAGLLRFHEVMSPVRRYKWIFNVHRTALLRERATGSLYVVDSWFRDNGEPAVVQPLDVWRRGWEDPY